MKRKWINRILGWLYDLALWPHPWPWPRSLKVRVWYSLISGMGWLIDMDPKSMWVIHSWPLYRPVWPFSTNDGLTIGKLWLFLDSLGWLRVALFSKWYLKSCIHFNILTVVTECNFHWTSTTSGSLRLIRIISKVVKEVIGHWMALHSVWWNRENSSVWGCSWH